MSRRVAILIGNGRFHADPALSNLGGPENDVRLLAEVLGTPDLGDFNVESFVDQESHTLQRALEQRLNQAGRDDLVLMYYSGHGKLDSRGQLCLAAANTTLGALKSTSLSLPFLKGLVDDCRSDRIVLILDCCYSGAASKAFAVRSTVDDQLAATQQQGAGFYILTSSTAVETSREREHDQGGMLLGNFTRCLVDAIESGDADVNHTAETTLTDLQAYLERSVRGQTPGRWAFDTRGEIVIAKNPRVKAAQLPDAILTAIGHPLPVVRASIVGELERLLIGPNLGLALSAFDALTALASDDSQRVSAAAARVLSERPHRTARTSLIEGALAPPVEVRGHEAPIQRPDRAPFDRPPTRRSQPSTPKLRKHEQASTADVVTPTPSVEAKPTGGSVLLDWRPWGVVIASTTVAMAVQGMAYQMVIVVAPQMEWALPGGAIGSTALPTLIAIVIGSAAGGLLGDRLGLRRILVGSVAFDGVLTALIAGTNSMAAFGFLRFLTGLTFGAAIPNAVALSSEYAPRRRHALAVTLTVSGLSLGGLLGGVLGGVLVPNFLFWRPALLLFGAIFVAVAALLLPTLPKAPRARTPESLFQPQLRSHTLLSCVSFFLAFLAPVVAAVPRVLAGSVFPRETTATMTTLASVAALVCAVSAGAALDHFGARHVMSALIMGSAAAAVIVGFVYPHEAASYPFAVAGVATLVSVVQLTMYAVVIPRYATGLKARAAGIAVACGRVAPLISITVFSAYGNPQLIYGAAAGSMIVLLVAAIALTRPRLPAETNSQLEIT